MLAIDLVMLVVKRKEEVVKREQWGLERGRHHRERRSVCKTLLIRTNSSQEAKLIGCIMVNVQLRSVGKRSWPDTTDGVLDMVKWLFQGAPPQPGYEVEVLGKGRKGTRC